MVQVQDAMIVGDFDENGCCEADRSTSLNDEAWLLDQFHVLPLGVARDGLEKPLTGDCRAVRVAGRHDRELEERSRPSIKHLNVHSVDFLELLRQNGVVVSVQDLRKG